MRFKGTTALETNLSLQLSCNIHVADVFVSDADSEKGTAKVVLRSWRVVWRLGQFHLLIWWSPRKQAKYCVISGYRRAKYS